MAEERPLCLDDNDPGVRHQRPEKFQHLHRAQLTAVAQGILRSERGSEGTNENLHPVLLSPTCGARGFLKPREMSPLPPVGQSRPAGWPLPRLTALWEGQGRPADGGVGRGFVKASGSLSPPTRPKQGSRFPILLESHEH